MSDLILGAATGSWSAAFTLVGVAWAIAWGTRAVLRELL